MDMAPERYIGDNVTVRKSRLAKELGIAGKRGIVVRAISRGVYLVETGMGETFRAPGSVLIGV